MLRPIKFTSTNLSHNGTSDRLPVELQKTIVEASTETENVNYSAVLALYKKILPDYPDMEIIRNNTGCCYAALGKFDEAETEFIEAIRIARTHRDAGKYVPRSYPKEPTRNLVNLYKLILLKKQGNYGISHVSNTNISRLASIRQTIRRISRSLKQKGIRAALNRIPKFLHTRSNPVIAWHDRVSALRAEEYDMKHHIDTAGIIYQTDLEMDNKNQQHAVYYQASDTLIFNNAIASLKIDYSKYAFIDFGSGKGKALFLASDYPFGRIIGVEFSEALHAIAQENIRQLNKESIELCCMDAVDYKIPGDPVVCYFYDPFEEFIMTKVLGNIRRAYDAGNRNIVIIYYIARFSGLFDAEPWLTKVNHIGPVMIWASAAP